MWTTGKAHNVELTTTILALDLGSKTGWAANKGPISSGVVCFAPGRFEGGGMRFLKFRRWLSSTISLVEPAEIVFEEVRRHIGTDAAHVYGGLLGQLTAYCEEHSIPYRGVPVGTIKRHATGKGNADKQAVTAAMCALGHSPADDNEADALALLHYAMEEAKCA